MNEKKSNTSVQVDAGTVAKIQAWREFFRDIVLKTVVIGIALWKGGDILQVIVKHLLN